MGYACLGCATPVFISKQGYCVRCIPKKGYPRGCGYCRKYTGLLPFCDEECAKGAARFNKLKLEVKSE